MFSHRSATLRSLLRATEETKRAGVSFQAAAKRPEGGALRIVHVSSILSLLLVFLAITQGRAQVGAIHPAGVPDGYVVTPFGYSHYSCVRHLVEGDVFVEDSSAIQHADGTVENIPACQFRDYTLNGEPAA
jgi:hypothetical protein